MRPIIGRSIFDTFVHAVREKQIVRIKQEGYYTTCVLISFNNRPVGEAIPVSLATPPAAIGDLVQASTQAVFADESVKTALLGASATADLAETLFRSAAGKVQPQDKVV